MCSARRKKAESILFAVFADVSMNCECYRRQYRHLLLNGEVTPLLRSDPPSCLEVGFITDQHAYHSLICVCFDLYTYDMEVKPSSQLVTSAKDLGSVMSYTMMMP